MGAEGSKEKKVRENEKRVDQRVLIAFEALAQGSPTVQCAQFTAKLGEDLGSDLWKYLSDSASEKWSMDMENFAQRFPLLIGHSTDQCIEMLHPADHLFRVCALCAAVPIAQSDETFLHSLSTHIENNGTDWKSVAIWKNENATRLCDAVQNRLLHSFNLSPTPSLSNYNADVLSPLQMWFLHCSLPSLYFPQTDKEGEDSNGQCWTELYSSVDQGISVTRFEANVFDYRGPTVAVFQLSDGTIFVLAVDQEWRNSGSVFGSVNTVFMRLTPSFERVQKASALYCNLKLRSHPMKLTFDQRVTIDKEMNNVVAMEVFGCSGAKTLEHQRQQKEWQKRQVEKNRKVPLPGKWDDNPDKFLLELGGVYSTADRREVFPSDD